VPGLSAFSPAVILELFRELFYKLAEFACVSPTITLACPTLLLWIRGMFVDIRVLYLEPFHRTPGLDVALASISAKARGYAGASGGFTR
jgi:hypothetical protein